MNLIKTTHLLIGICAMLIATAQQILVILDKGGMKPYNPYLNWRQENTMLCFTVFIVGFILVLSTIKIYNPTYLFQNLLITTGLMAVVAFSIFQRNFSSDAGIFTFLALLDGICISFVWLKQSASIVKPLLAAIIFTSTFAFYLLFLGFGVFNVGE